MKPIGKNYKGGHMFTIFVIVILVAAFVVEAVLTEVELFGWATITLVSTVITAHFVHLIDLVSVVRLHFVSSVLYMLAYLAIGIVWSFVKWFSFLLSFRDEYRRRKEEFLFKNQYANNFDGNEAFIKSACYSNFHDNTLTHKPLVSRNKARIVAWMSFWPFSLVGTFINDPARKLFNFLFNRFKALYQRMSDTVFASHPELK
jgi:hypothetical protein